MKSISIKKRKIIITAFTAILTILITTRSYGLSLSIEDFFSLIIDDIKDEMRELKRLAQTKVEETWAGIKEDASAAIEDAIGEMETPDPIKSGEDLKARIAEIYSLPVAQQKVQDLERELTRASISAILGNAGQEDTAKKIESTTQTAQSAKDLAEQAQQMDASQDILKTIAAQNAQIVSMLAQERTDSLLSRHDAAQSNLMLTQIAENIAVDRKKTDLNQLGTLSLSHELAGITRLDPTIGKE